MDWYAIKNKTDEVTEVWIYDQIGEDWFGEGVTAKGFIKELGAIKTPKLDLHINSPGGSVFDGQAIYNALKNHAAKVTTYIDALAGSIASVIALAGDRVIIAENGTMMVHDPSGMVAGTSTDMRKMADVLDMLRDTISGTYQRRTGKSAEEVNAVMAAETWFDAAGALDFGLVDEIGGAVAAEASFDLSHFKHPPQDVGKRNSASDTELLTAARDNIDTVLGNDQGDGEPDADDDEGATDTAAAAVSDEAAAAEWPTFKVVGGRVRIIED